MPSIYRILGYNIYFWSDEGVGVSIEPVHVHASKTPSSSSTKFWITSDGKAMLANNSSKISKKDLKIIANFIQLNAMDIILMWSQYFNVNPKFIK